MREWIKIGGDYFAVQAIWCIRPVLEGRLEIVFLNGGNHYLGPKESAALQKYLDGLGENGLVADIDKLATASVSGAVAAYSSH